MEDGSQRGRSLIKQLACCNKTSRDKALRVLLKVWLPSQSQLPEDDMKKLWKGLFYCVWHADKVPVQSDLIDRLSSQLLALNLDLSLQYFSSFFLTMRREWSGIDSLRLDKFYLLIRRFIHKVFLLLKNNSWNLELTQRLMGILDEKTFSADDKLQGNGVNYHIASVFLEELKSFLPLRLEVLEVLFKPFFCVMSKFPDKVLLGKIKSNLFDVLLKMGKRLLEVKKAGDEVDSGDNTLVLGTIALVMGFSSKFFDLGSSPECCQGNRKLLLGLHEEFMKLEKDTASSGFEFSIPDVANQDEEEEVPTLVPIADKMKVALEGDLGHDEIVANGSNGATNKRLKKSKKDKKASVGSAKKAKKKKNDLSDETVDENENVASANGENSDIEGDLGHDEVVANGSNGVTNKRLKKSKKDKKASVGSAKKAKKKKNDLSDETVDENENVASANGENSDIEQTNDVSTTILNESVISNLQRQFEKIAAEAGLDDGVASAIDSPEATTVSKKRKRTKSVRGQQSENTDINAEDTIAKTEEKSEKKVRFSMKNNLVWKPHSPLPPQSLRLPSSVTPRGSALKKGVPPGPVREMPSSSKIGKLKKVRKTLKGVSPSVKRLKKLKSRSA